MVYIYIYMILINFCLYSFIHFSVGDIFDYAKLPVESVQLRSYLTSVGVIKPTASVQLWSHLPNMDVMFSR